MQSSCPAGTRRVLSPTSSRIPSLRKAGTIEIRSSGSTSSIVSSPPVAAASAAKLATSMCSEPMRKVPPPSRSTPVDPEDVRADPLDLGADRDEEAAEILDVRLAGGVADDRLALRRARRP